MLRAFSYKIILCFYNNNNHYSVFNRFKKHTLHKLILIFSCRYGFFLGRKLTNVNFHLTKKQ